jgi:glycine betaine catabolism A
MMTTPWTCAGGSAAPLSGSTRPAAPWSSTPGSDWPATAWSSPGLDKIAGVGPDHDRRYYAITVLPQVFISLVPDHVIFHRMYPAAADRTVVECDWLCRPDSLAAGKDISHSVELFHRVNQQDFDACERCQPSMSSRLYRDGGVLVPSEHHIAAFHEWVQQRTGAGQ